MRAVTAVLALLISLTSIAAPPGEGPRVPEPCGDYEVDGMIKVISGNPVLSVYEGSGSEVLLSVPPEMRISSYAYLDRTVTVRGKLLHPIQNYQGEIELESLEDRMPDPLRDPRTNAFRLISSLTCAAQ